MILTLIRENSKLSRRSLAVKLAVSEATIKRDISFLSNLGLIVRIGPDKGGYWKIKNL